jgi:hypothetical protein
MTDCEIVDTHAENISSCSLCRHKHVSNPGHRRKRTVTFTVGRAVRPRMKSASDY